MSFRLAHPLRPGSRFKPCPARPQSGLLYFPSSRGAVGGLMLPPPLPWEAGVGRAEGQTSERLPRAPTPAGRRGKPAGSGPPLLLHSLAPPARPLLLRGGRALASGARHRATPFGQGDPVALWLVRSSVRPPRMACFCPQMSERLGGQRPRKPGFGTSGRPGAAVGQGLLPGLLKETRGWPHLPSGQV